MPRLDLASRKTAISLIMQDYSVMDMKKCLEEENVVVTRQSLYFCANIVLTIFMLIRQEIPYQRR